MEAGLTSKPYEWGVSSLTHRGETKCGDQYVVKAFTGGVLVALIDALGHGDNAAYAAQVAVNTLTQYAQEPPLDLMQRCHAEMRGTRGAAISLASFDWHRRIATWLGIGNVAGVIVNADTVISPTSLIVRGGVIGDRLPKLHSSVIPLTGETTLVAATDGVREDFREILPVALDPQRTAERILVEFGRCDDDATVLVFRCRDASSC